MQVLVKDDGELSEPILVTNGVEQGCVLALTLLSMLFSAMLTEAFKDGKSYVDIQLRMDGGCSIISDFVSIPRPKGIVCAIFCLLMIVLLMQALQERDAEEHEQVF